MITESSLLDRKVLKDGHKFDQSLLWMVGLMTAFSILMIYSASIATTIADNKSALYYVQRQVIFVGLGILCSIVAAFIPMATWQKHTPKILFISFCLLVLVLIVGRKINGARRWLDLGPVNLQPTEIFKLAMIFYLSSFFTRRAEVLNNWKRMIFPGVLVGLGFALVLGQRDLGSTVVLASIALGLLFLAGLPVKWFIVMTGAALVVFVMFIIFEPYRMRRLTGFLDPWSDENVLADGYQLTHSLMAIARGEWTGVGLGASVEKRGFLPEAHTDFILAIIGEKFGFIGMVLLIICYIWLIWRAFTIAKQARDLELFFGAFVAHGIALWLGTQSLIHFGVNVGMLPTKGLTLPLMSYGGTSAVIMLVCMALLLRVDYENRLKMRGFDVKVEVQKKR